MAEATGWNTLRSRCRHIDYGNSAFGPFRIGVLHFGLAFRVYVKVIDVTTNNALQIITGYLFSTVVMHLPFLAIIKSADICHKVSRLPQSYAEKDPDHMLH